MKARIFNVSGPYAVGKDSVLNDLVREFEPQVHRVATLTTRPVDSIADPTYTHADPEEFRRIVDSGRWIFNKQLSGETAYATNLDEIDSAIDKGLVCIHSIYAGDAGAGELKRNYGSRLFSIALIPPGDSISDQFTELEARLLKRNRDDTRALRLRTSHQKEPLEYINSQPEIVTEDGQRHHVFDEVLVNSDLAETIRDAREIFFRKCIDG
ncbi:hypothetical protein QNM97_23170 [Gordonia sp. L191]|uniref:hypothetical protein n=1 Tax=Gordonia sp. L191 TaxID=2982699 RepID=UPI0024BFB252|nr:hypothetical protein [Gordonia sp. L191]WHU46833.1 hypothetical protein QNM97_23170 [Gordonia sp. L191]